MVDSVVQESNKPIKKYTIPKQIPKVIFRAYDIRGHVSENELTDQVTYAIGCAIGSEAIALGEKEIIVGRDGRLSGISLHSALCAGLQASGCSIIDIGMVPTPLLYFATHRLSSQSGVMITASHNPADDNGFKIVLQGKTLTSERIALLYQRIVEKNFCHGQGEYRREDDIISDYLKYIIDHVQLLRPLKIVIDCGNGAAGIVATELFRALGCEVIELFCEVDGRFPNHHPDPTIPENLSTLINTVKKEGADCGLAFDGDADRLGVVTELGEIIWPDRQLMLYALDILSRYPGAEIIFDVKCSRDLIKVIRAAGGVPLMWRTGHSIIKNKMLEEGAPLAGEMSGHIFFQDDWFGFDDAMYVGARLLKILSQTNKSCSEIFAELPNSVNTPELKLPMPEKDKAEFMQRLLTQANFDDAELTTIDGVRVDFDFGWGLVRPSNTSPYLILRFEADTKNNLDKIKTLFRKQLLLLDPGLALPF